MSDKETLILAAKAMGIESALALMSSDGVSIITVDGKKWNPLTSNDDCFRLETALGVTLEWCDDWECPYVKARIGERYASAYYLDHNGDKDKARRYASTRAAALMGGVNDAE